MTSIPGEQPSADAGTTAQPAPAGARRLLAAGGIVLLIAAPVVGYFLVALFHAATAPARWPTVRGTLLEAELQAVSHGMDTRYRPAVRYEYAAGGRVYTGERLGRGEGESKRRADAQLPLQGLSPGQAIEVHYNPADPAESILRPGAGAGLYAALILPLLLLGTGITMLVLWRRAARR